MSLQKTQTYWRTQDAYMWWWFAVCAHNKDDNKHNKDHNWLLGWLWYKGSQIYMLTPIGVIIPVWFYVVLAWECFCLLSAQCIILFIIRVMLFDFYISYMFILCKPNWLHYNSIAVWDITDCVCLSLCIKSYCQVLFV